MSQEHPSVAGGACGPEEVLSYWFPKAPPWPLGGPCPPRAWRTPRRGGSGKSAAPPEGDGRVRRLSSQSRPPRHSALRASPAPQRDTRAYLHAGGARVPEDRNAATLASASFLLRPYSPECVEEAFS